MRINAAIKNANMLLNDVRNTLTPMVPRQYPTSSCKININAAVLAQSGERWTALPCTGRGFDLPRQGPGQYSAFFLRERSCCPYPRYTSARRLNISGGFRGGARPPPLSQGLDDRSPPPTPFPSSGGLDPARNMTSCVDIAVPSPIGDVKMMSSVSKLTLQ